MPCYVTFYLYVLHVFLQVLWLDVRYGQIAAGDQSGKAALVNFEGEVIWSKDAEGTYSYLVSNCVHVHYIERK